MLAAAIVVGGLFLALAISVFTIAWSKKMAAEWWEQDFAPRECETCGAMFVPKFRGACQCFLCFIETPAGRAWQERKARATGQGAPRWNGIDRRRTTSNAPVGVDATFVRKLLQLCHPDKHKNSDLANAVTVELLRMKDRL